MSITRRQLEALMNQRLTRAGTRNLIHTWQHVVGHPLNYHQRLTFPHPGPRPRQAPPPPPFYYQGVANHVRYEDLPSIGEPAMELVGEVTHYESWKGGDVWYLTWEDEQVRLGERRKEKAKRKRNWGVCFLCFCLCFFVSVPHSLHPFLSI
jgi:hypothetical protein